MKPVPLAPTRKQKGIKLQMLALERARNRLQARLLPAATRLAILEDFVAGYHACVVEEERLIPGGGPEHEGRVAVGSPRHRDWAIGKPVLNESVLRQDSRRVRLRDLSIAHTD